MMKLLVFVLFCILILSSAFGNPPINDVKATDRGYSSPNGYRPNYGSPGGYDNMNGSPGGYNNDPSVRCLLNIEIGLCKAYFKRYAYDVKAKKCVGFIYGGCGGNDNRFDSLQECIETCE